MAWTKAKTAITTGIIVLFAAGTTVATVAHTRQPHTKPASPVPVGMIPVTDWKFKGFATPEDAFESQLYAASQGDAKAFAEAETPEYRQQSRAKETKTEAQVSRQLKSAAHDKIRGFEVISRETISDDEVILHVRAADPGYAQVRLKKIDGLWKVDEEPRDDRSAHPTP